MSGGKKGIKRGNKRKGRRDGRKREVQKFTSIVKNTNVCLQKSHSLVALFPVPRPAFRRLQYGKAGRAWYISSREHDVINFQNEDATFIQPTHAKSTSIVRACVTGLRHRASKSLHSS